MSLVANKELLAQTRKLKIISKRLAASQLVGDYTSAFRGTGFEFDQLREYQYGDDVRFINWNASAKNNTLMLKEFVPERDRVVILVVDCSSSLHFSSQTVLKCDIALLLSATLAFMANLSNDRVGMLAFTDKVNCWIPPQKGRLVVTRILDELCLAMKQGGKTNIAEALKFLLNNKLSNCIMFLISDWINESNINTRELRLLAKKHDVVAMRILDPLERSLPKVGHLNTQDPESGTLGAFNADAAEIATLLQARCKQQHRLLQNCGIELLDLTVGEKIDRVLANFFHKRTKRYEK